MVSKEDVAALYVALFNRAPEGEGLDSWYNAALSNNWGIGELAESMLLAAQQIVSSSPEYQSVYFLLLNVILHPITTSIFTNFSIIQSFINFISICLEFICYRNLIA